MFTAGRKLLVLTAERMLLVKSSWWGKGGAVSPPTADSKNHGVVARAEIGLKNLWGSSAPVAGSPHVCPPPGLDDTVPIES